MVGPGDERPRFSRVAVLKGGPSAERDVSLRSGEAVTGGLRDAGYRVEAIDITGTDLPDLQGIDAVFIALHGAFGEDGVVQAQLTMRGIPYTGSKAEASRLAFDKVLCKDRLREHGVPVADHEVLDRGQDCSLSLPVVVKPARQGSTIGISFVEDLSSLAGAVEEASKFDSKVMVETYIPGREVTVGIVDGRTLPIVEVVTPGNWYSYDAKYVSGGTDYLIPAPLDPACAERCANAASAAYRAIGCEGMARIDFRVDGDQIYCLEVNTIPGFTASSLLPKAAAHAGIGFSELCDRIMRTAAV